MVSFMLFFIKKKLQEVNNYGRITRLARFLNICRHFNPTVSTAFCPPESCNKNLYPPTPKTGSHLPGCFSSPRDISPDREAWAWLALGQGRYGNDGEHKLVGFAGCSIAGISCQQEKTVPPYSLLGCYIAGCCNSVTRILVWT